jgi:hypothetical protein
MDKAKVTSCGAVLTTQSVFYWSSGTQIRAWTTIAFTRQACSQSMQPVQRSGLGKLGISFSNTMALGFVGHTDSQVPQETHARTFTNTL